MDPEEIEKKISELTKNIEDEQRKGQLKLKTMKTLEADLNAGAQKIMGWTKKIEAFREVLGK